MKDRKIIECPDGLVGYDITLTRLGPWVQLPLWIWLFVSYQFTLCINKIIIFI